MNPWKKGFLEQKGAKQFGAKPLKGVLNAKVIEGEYGKTSESIWAATLKKGFPKGRDCSLFWVGHN